MIFLWIVVVGFIFAALDAFGIGANDVANSFATAVGSRTLTLKQAVCIATVMEFTGAIALGANTADTIRGKILNATLFRDEPYLLMLGMMCALIGSATWILFATRIGFPVSTTHSIIGAIIGVGIAAKGPLAVFWGYDNNGFSQIVASWFISPAFAGGLAACLFLVTDFGVLRSNNSFKRGLWTIPIYVAATTCLICFFIIYKGAPGTALSTIKVEIAGGIAAGTGVGCGIIAALTFVPWAKRRVAREDEKQRIAEQQAAERAAEVEKQSTAVDMYAKGTEGHELELDSLGKRTPVDSESMSPGGSLEKPTDITGPHETIVNMSIASHLPSTHEPIRELSVDEKVVEPKWYHNKYLQKVGKVVFHGVNQDVVGHEHNKFEDLHSHVTKYDSKTERLFSLVQIMTCSVASFAHGSNDVSNAVGPLTTIYFIWQEARVASKQPVPVWLLAYAGAFIVLGLATFGYTIMRELGNKITYHSPSRGYCMELGAATAVLTASRMGWPVSTTHCISGATVGVGLSSGNLHAVNWGRFALFFFGWVITLPVAGTIAGLVFAMMAYAPKAYTSIA